MDEPEERGAAARLSDPLLAVAEVTKHYTGRAAVQKLALTLHTGEVFGLVGSNGGGKTTTLRILAGILTPDHGRGQVLGFDLWREAREIRRHVGYMSQRFSLYGELSVYENLRFRADIYGVDKPRLATEAIIDDFALGPYGRRAAKQLSGGWARRLQLAATLIHSPKLLLLDEPTAGLDAVSRHEVWRRVGQAAAQGAGVIVSTHDLAEAERCASIAFLSEGQVIAVGAPEQVVQHALVQAFLLSKTDLSFLTSRIDAIPGVIASYPQGASLRIIAEAAAAPQLQHEARRNDARLSEVPLRLEDAALVFSKRAAWNLR